MLGFLRKNCRIEGMPWDLFHFYSSFWAFCIAAFRGVPLHVLQLSWSSVCNSKEVDNVERVRFWFLRYFVHAFICSPPCTVEEYSLTLIRFCILWEGPLILLLNLTIINIYIVTDKKKSCQAYLQYLVSTYKYHLLRYLHNHFPRRVWFSFSELLIAGPPLFFSIILLFPDSVPLHKVQLFP